MLTLDQATRIVGKAQLRLYELEQKYLYLTKQDPIQMPKFLTFGSIGSALVQLREVQTRIHHVEDRLSKLIPLPENEASTEILNIAQELELEIYLT